MISCYELRLGNHVLLNGNLQRVTKITSTTISTINVEENNGRTDSEYSVDQIDPVPMTNEVLEQCGFIFHNYFKFWQLKTLGNSSEMEIDRDYYVIDLMRKAIVKKLASLHQLQNVYFMLKGRELILHKATMANA